MIHLQLDVRSIPTKNLIKGFDSNCFFEVQVPKRSKILPTQQISSKCSPGKRASPCISWVARRPPTALKSWCLWFWGIDESHDASMGRLRYFYIFLPTWMVDFHGKCREILPSTHGSNGEWTIFAEFDHFWASKSHQRGPKCLQQNDHLYTGLTWVGGKEEPIWNLLG